MAEAISNTSPLLYLYRIGAVDWLGELFQGVWAPGAVALELKDGRRKGHDVPTLSDYGWLKIVNPQFMPSEWLALDLGKGELAAMALALENPGRVVLLDDALVRRFPNSSQDPRHDICCPEHWLRRHWSRGRTWEELRKRRSSTTHGSSGRVDRAGNARHFARREVSTAHRANRTMGRQA
jgi:hypothetical protein